MATQRHGQIVETPTEARQAEPGPSVLALLTVSTGLAILILGIVWFVFFRTVEAAISACGPQASLPFGRPLCRPMRPLGFDRHVRRLAWRSCPAAKTS